MTQILLILMSLSLYAADDAPVCKDLFRLACSDTSLTDGTGKTLSNQERDRWKAKQASRFAQKTKTELMLQMNKSDAVFMDSLLKATEASSLPACKAAKLTAPYRLPPGCRTSVGEAGAEILSTFENVDFETAGVSASSQAARLDFFQNSTVLGVRTRVGQSVRAEMGQASFDEKVRRLLPQIKESALRAIRDMPVEDVAKQYMFSCVTRIETVKTTCNGSFDTLPSMLTSEATFASPSQPSVIWHCVGSFHSNTSDFGVAQSILNAMSTCLSPAGMALFPSVSQSPKGATRTEADRAYPIPGLLSCLRGADSMHARLLDADWNPVAAAVQGSSFRAPADQAWSYSDADGVDSEGYIDQVDGAVQNWFMAQAMPHFVESVQSARKLAGQRPLSQSEIRNGYVNSLRPFSTQECEPGDENYLTPNPGVQAMANAALLANPQVRQQMGCERAQGEYKHCDPKMMVGDGPGSQKRSSQGVEVTR